jgi:hypothetical protein
MVKKKKEIQIKLDQKEKEARALKKEMQEQLLQKNSGGSQNKGKAGSAGSNQHQKAKGGKASGRTGRGMDDMEDDEDDVVFK